MERGIQNTKHSGVGKGFTLIELLVVIAIIALLMSIVMPALKKVKESARILVCRTNLRQLAMGNVTYAQGNKGRTIGGDFWNGITIHQDGRGYGSVGPSSYGHLLVGGYIPEPTSKKGVIYCPSDRSPWFPGGPGDRYTTIGNPRADDQRTFQYRFNQGFPALIDGGYEFRDSIDGGNKVWGWWDTTKPQKGAPIDKTNHHIILSDWVWTGQGGWHKGTYNLAQGDTTAFSYDDPKYGTPDNPALSDPEQRGFTNWVNAKFFMGPVDVWDQDYIYFDALDYILANAFYGMVYAEGEPKTVPLPDWRR